MPKHLPEVDQAEPGLEQSADSIHTLTGADIAPVPAADIELRNEFAKIAFAAIVAWQVENRKGGQEDVAASWAFRYGDRALTQSKVMPRGAAVHIKGVPGITEEPIVEVQ